MEPLRDWLIGRGWTSELATIAAVLAAFLVAYLIGWILRLLSKAPRARLLKSEEWKEPLEQRQVVPRFMRLISPRRPWSTMRIFSSADLTDCGFARLLLCSRHWTLPWVFLDPKSVS